MIPKSTILPTEAEDQIKLAVWLGKQGIKFTASANGGSRNMIEAVKLKRMGVSAGFPDIEVPLPIAQYHGLYIELKRASGGVLSKQQCEWLNYLRSQGYFAEVARGFEAAKDIVLHYLSLKKPAA